MNTEAKAAPTRSHSPSAARMRLYRRRQARRRRVVRIVDAMEIEALVATLSPAGREGGLECDRAGGSRVLFRRAL